MLNEEKNILADSLKLAVVPESFPRSLNWKSDCHRVIEIVPFSYNDRYPVSGLLTWTVNKEKFQKEVTFDDYDEKALTITISAPVHTTIINVVLESTDHIILKSSCTVEPVKMMPWAYYVKKSMDTLIEYGRDDYGLTKTPLIMAILDTATLRSPSQPTPMDAEVRLEGRIHRRGEQGSNLWYDQALIKAMHHLSDISNEKKYTQAADDFTRYFLKNCNKPMDNQNNFHTGLPAWGSHTYWSCFQNRIAGDMDGSGPHEILLFRANWTDMYEIAPESVRLIAERVWRYHVINKKTGQHNRHDDGNFGCDFAFSGGTFIHLFATLYCLTGSSHYLQQAKTVANWHWNNRNKRTNLPPDCPSLKDRYDGTHTFTTISGPYAMLLLESYRVSGDDLFREMATTYVKAYDRFGWDSDKQSYYAMLTLKGEPILDRKKGEGYDAYAPYGHVNVWRTTFFSYEFTLSAAQTAILAYELSGNTETERDMELLMIAKRWALVVEQSMPPRTGRRWKNELEQSMPLAKKVVGVYAEDYARAISLYVHLYRATDETHYLDLASTLAEDAVRKLYHNGLFRGHPAKPYYETTNGVGLLLYALLELESPDDSLEGAM